MFSLLVKLLATQYRCRLHLCAHEEDYTRHVPPGPMRVHPCSAFPPPPQTSPGNIAACMMNKHDDDSCLPFFPRHHIMFCSFYVILCHLFSCSFMFISCHFYFHIFDTVVSCFCVFKHRLFQCEDNNIGRYTAHVHEQKEFMWIRRWCVFVFYFVFLCTRSRKWQQRSFPCRSGISTRDSSLTTLRMACRTSTWAEETGRWVGMQQMGTYQNTGRVDTEVVLYSWPGMP